MILHRKGNGRQEWPKKAASTVIYAGGFVYPDGSGAMIPADSTAGKLWGVSQREVAATDDDYALSVPFPVLKGGEDDEFECDVVGTLTAAMEGNYYDLSDSKTVNVAAQAKKVVLCTKFISATKGLFKIAARAEVQDVATT